jgi:putative SOS response-associated peptidase YedK
VWTIHFSQSAVAAGRAVPRRPGRRRGPPAQLERQPGQRHPGGGRRQRRRPPAPVYVTSRDGEPLALAGLWATWRDPEGDGEELWTCTILTTTANKLMGSVHHRMPVILLPEAWDAWLDPDNKDVEQLTALLKPAPEELLALWPVDQAVSNPRNNRPELLEPLEGHQPVTA